MRSRAAISVQKVSLTSLQFYSCGGAGICSRDNRGSATGARSSDFEQPELNGCCALGCATGIVNYMVATGLPASCPLPPARISLFSSASASVSPHRPYLGSVTRQLGPSDAITSPLIPLMERAGRRPAPTLPDNLLETRPGLGVGSARRHQALGVLTPSAAPAAPQVGGLPA